MSTYLPTLKQLQYLDLSETHLSVPNGMTKIESCEGPERVSEFLTLIKI